MSFDLISWDRFSETQRLTALPVGLNTGGAPRNTAGGAAGRPIPFHVITSPNSISLGAASPYPPSKVHHAKENPKPLHAVAGACAAAAGLNAKEVEPAYQVSPMREDRDVNPSVISCVFKNYPFPSIAERLKNALIKSHFLDGKLLLTIDHLFDLQEGQELRTFVAKSSFPERIYSTPLSLKAGETTAKQLAASIRKKLLFFPPPPLDVMTKLFAYIGSKLNVDVSSLPWVPNIPHPLVNNFLTELDFYSSAIGWHSDYETDALKFRLADKRSNQSKFYEGFTNGAPGKPYILSIILYTTADNFDPTWGMGTLFADKNNFSLQPVGCQNMRIVIFEGEIRHKIVESHIPPGVNTWRNTFVWRIVLRPTTNENFSIKERFLSVFGQTPTQPAAGGPSAASESVLSPPAAALAEIFPRAFPSPAPASAAARAMDNPFPLPSFDNRPVGLPSFADSPETIGDVVPWGLPPTITTGSQFPAPGTGGVSAMEDS